MSTQFYIITGVSGAGKSQALKILEDLGFFCVDNLPMELVPRFADLCLELGGKLQNVALSIDIRAGKSLALLDTVLAEIRAKKINYRIIYFFANDATLLKRYSETRRRHPLGKHIIDGIHKERRLLERIHSLASQEIDTSLLNLSELKEILANQLDIALHKKMAISLMSFGYKHGIPISADLVIDVRFLPNPNYVPSMRAKTGLDASVRRYVQKQKMYREFLNRFLALIDFLVPNYVKEGKSYLTIAVGCTGGRHRSVVIAEAIAQYLKHKKYTVHREHRDIGRKL